MTFKGFETPAGERVPHAHGVITAATDEQIAGGG